jgi:hypothetical protein
MYFDTAASAIDKESTSIRVRSSLCTSVRFVFGYWNRPAGKRADHSVRCLFAGGSRRTRRRILPDFMFLAAVKDARLSKTACGL